VDGTIAAGDIASNAVTTVKILDANVTSDKLAANSVITAKILDNNITLGKLSTDIQPDGDQPILFNQVFG
jgi:hypothetical protein